ncbi:hypothetical protein C900_02847 [Fulvivirga imtechensis AK7]|uniref:Uncharacterized protein n=1 Tax=Fulvivirga imtechensis AK7 TaxID=1237149 RepID=L8JVH0_9BACT|nr:hypothetical protein [Fulvivirga imtechensis]ELR71232.1 hypothetical protein C900_02847 [Fulvivirga imtechensis AK7]
MTPHIDALQYTYTNGNQLTAVADAAGWEGFADKNTTGPDYTYDANGNMTKDLDKEIESIEYNHLNLSAKAVKADGHYIQYPSVAHKLLKPSAASCCYTVTS